MEASQRRIDSVSTAPGVARSPEVAAARRYCRKLAKSHYENFIVGSVLIPRKLTQHLYNIYAFCRISDDLADETADPAQALQLLADWKTDLRRCPSGRPRHPALIALQTTIHAFDMPLDMFEDLLSAFEQDCRVNRYDTYADLLDYCSRSANPVGRIFLWLFGYKDSTRQELSDRICTALQLANFWQDVASDHGRGRIYLPGEDMRAFGCEESDIAEQRVITEFVELMRFEVDRTERLFVSAAELPALVSRRLAVDVELFRRAGLAVLGEIRKNGCDVLTKRPVVSKVEKTRLFAKCLLGIRLRD